jgi:hypothetical protein
VESPECGMTNPQRVAVGLRIAPFEGLRAIGRRGLVTNSPTRDGTLFRVSFTGHALKFYRFKFFEIFFIRMISYTVAGSKFSVCNSTFTFCVSVRFDKSYVALLNRVADAFHWGKWLKCSC